MIRLEQIGLKESGEKCSRSEQSKNITERENIRSKKEEKSLVRMSERRVRKVVQSRADRAVYCRTTQSEEHIQADKSDKQRQQSTTDDGR